MAGGGKRWGDCIKGAGEDCRVAGGHTEKSGCGELDGC